MSIFLLKDCTINFGLYYIYSQVLVLKTEETTKWQK